MTNRVESTTSSNFCVQQEKRRNAFASKTQPQHMMMITTPTCEIEVVETSISELNNNCHYHSYDYEHIEEESNHHRNYYPFEDKSKCRNNEYKKRLRLSPAVNYHTNIDKRNLKQPQQQQQQQQQKRLCHKRRIGTKLLCKLPILVIFIITTTNSSYAFSISSTTSTTLTTSRTLSFVPPNTHGSRSNHVRNHVWNQAMSTSTPFSHRQSITYQTATKSSTSPPEEIIQEVKPLTASTNERRKSVQRAWEEQANILDVATSNDENNLDGSKASSSSSSSSSISATPFLDLFTDAGIARTRRVKRKKSSLKNIQEIKPKGRPASVPGAMSRATMMGINEMESRSYSPNRKTDYTSSSSSSSSPSLVDDEDEDSFITAISSSKFGRKSVAAATVSKVSSTTLNKNKNGNNTVKKRNRGRPRKETVKIAPTDSTIDNSYTSKESTSATETIATSESKSISSQDNPSNDNGKMTKTRSKRGQLKTLRPKSKKLKETEKEAETTGMMQTGKGSSIGGGKGGKSKDGEPPNLQRYYRTELLTLEEEYTLGMKIQFMIQCELVHDGLCEQLERNPTIEEWAYACGFNEESSSVRDDLNSMEPGYVEQIRPLKCDVVDPIEDANKFVGNGLVNASGPGRGRGRTKKAPPTLLKDYYDDSEIKFEKDYEKRLKLLKPLNRGTPSTFVELMISAKEAKRRMVQCNMRLVVSISKRYKHVGVNIADLVQEGSIGLTRAAEKFDPKKGFKFSTYASW